MGMKLLLASVMVASLMGGPAFAAACNLELGARISKKCKVCHTFEEGGRKKIGPNLFHVFGRTAGTKQGYGYSKAMKARGAAGLVWNAEVLNEFLTKPRKFVEKTKMTFPGLKKVDERAALICWLEKETGGMP